MLWGNGFLDVLSDWSAMTDSRLVRDGEYHDDGRRRPLSCAAEFQLPYLPGIDVGVYPGEAVDFVMGWFGLDAFDDDLARLERYCEPGPEPVEIEAEETPCPPEPDDEAEPADETPVEEEASADETPVEEEEASAGEPHAETDTAVGESPRPYRPNTALENAP